MKVVFSDRAYISLLAEVREHIETETGGLFLGYYSNDTWYIIEACDPGPASIFLPAYFEYDQAYVKHLLNKLARIYCIKPKLIGLWHRHPGSFDVFSGTDDTTNEKFAAMDPKGAVSMLVNIDPVFRLTVYHVAAPHRYTRIAYCVGNGNIPQEYLKLKTQGMIFNRSNFVTSLNNSLYSVFESILPAMERIELPHQAEEIVGTDFTDQVSDTLLDDLLYLTDTLGIHVKVEMTEIVISENCAKLSAIRLSDGETDGILFTIYREKNCIYNNGQLYNYHSGLIKELMEEQISIDTKPDDGPTPHVSAKEKNSFLNTFIHRFDPEKRK